MEKGMSEYVKKLVELDSSAVKLADLKENEVFKLENDYKIELENYKKTVDSAVEKGKEKRKEILNNAAQEVNKMKEATSIRLKKIDKKFDAVKDNIVQQLWNNIIK